MLRSRRTIAAAVSIAVSLGSAGVIAHADTGSVLYVDDNAAADCTDTGSEAGAAATPFCTIQAASDAAVPGDTVDIATGSYVGAVTVTSSGTATAPIVFQATGSGTVSITDPKGQTGPALSFTGASYVEFEGSLGIGASENQRFNIAGVEVGTSSHITLDSISASSFSSSDTAVAVAGSSSGVTVTRSMLWAGIAIAAGSSGDVISTNDVVSGISLHGAVNTSITSNTLWGSVTPLPPDMIDIMSSSTGTTIENNIVVPPAEGAFGIYVDSTSAPGTTEDYNVVSSGVVSAYSWAGVNYPTRSAFNEATGQGAHDLMYAVLNPSPYTDVSTAPQINSANSAAPGMLATDMYGYPCTASPIVAVTGAGSPAYCARGAVQQQYTTTVTATATPAEAMSVDLSSAVAQTSQAANISVKMPQAPTPAVSYVVDWGDGTTSAPTPGSATDTSTAMTHTYAKTGTYTITDTAKLTDGSTTATTTTVTTAGSLYTPFGPTRMLDTRHGTGAPAAKVDAGSSVGLTVAGVHGIPAGVSAVVLNLTVTDATGNGYLSAAAAGAQPATSSLNYKAGQTVANSVIVPVADGGITIWNKGAGSADIIADVSGYFTQNAGSSYQPAALKRILDTRHGTGAPEAKVAADTGLPVTIAGADSIPAGVTAVALHVTVVDTTGNGWIAAEPYGAGTPTTSILNYLKGQTISNTVIVPVSANGKVELYNGGGTTPVDLLADVSGYFSTTAPDAYVPVGPTRAWDSRQIPGWTLAGDSTQEAWLDGGIGAGMPDPYPANATLVSNITVTDTKGNGYLTVYPYGTTRPAVSNLNYLTGQTVANLAILSTSGTTQGVDVYNNSTSSTDVIFDVFGYFSNH